MVASLFFCMPRHASSGMPPRARRWGYRFLYNSIQLELYCPCSSIVIYLMATKAVLNKPTVQERLP
jgi:hypothetical protein